MPATRMVKPDLRVISFATPQHLRKWLAANHASSPGIWMRIFKKDSGRKSVNYDQALDVALCYGWIDGLRKKYDVLSFIQRFTPRRKKSAWSKRNREHVARLIACRQMRAAGLKEVESAKADGRWAAASEAPRGLAAPADFLAELAKDQAAEEFFKTLNDRSVSGIAWMLATAKKPQTRRRRMKKFLEMMARGKKLG